ncbi:MAG: PilN domain-containing protein [Ignavibacteriaceae bacterium]
MDPIIFTYCEGNDTKLAVFIKEKDKLKFLKAGSFDIIQTTMGMEESIAGLKIDGDEMSFEGSIGKSSPEESKVTISSIGLINEALKGFNLKKSLFVPTLTEPSIYYHVFEGAKVSNASKITQEIITDIHDSKNVSIDKDSLDYIELSDKSLLSVFLTGEVNCIKLISSLANYNHRRYYKIPSVKSAEISLAYYTAKKKKFFPDDNSLIVYIGREFSKLIFLHGRKLKHIGSTLDIGTINLHTYDVYFSKILLEMENGGISSLDNIVVCGEDDSENLILSFYGTFPEANVSKLNFSDIDISSLDSLSKEKISSFSVPIAAAIDYFDDIEKVHKGINLLPRYVIEDQKIFQFAWHGFAMFPLLFLAAFLITVKALENNKNIDQLNSQLEQQTLLLRQNQEILDKISNLTGKINGFSQTQAILDSASTGTGAWSYVLRKISSFFEARENIWLTKLSKPDGETVALEGYALSKNVLTEFAFSIKSAQLKSISYEALRDQNVYKFNITFNLPSYYKGAQ